MKYEKSATTSGVFNIAIAVITIAGLCAMQYFFFSRPNIPMMLPVVVWAIGGIVALVFGCLGVSLVQSGGSWLITVDRNGISWASPNEKADKSFRLALSDLARVETRIRRAAKGRTKRSYFLITRSGGERKLSPNSGISLANVVAELERLGVDHQTVRVGSNLIVGC